MSSHSHHSGMMGHTGKMHGKGDTSQNAAVNQLNEQSLAAAQRGQTFGGSNMGAGGMSTGSSAGTPDTGNMK